MAPLGEMACAQVLEKPPDLRGVTIRLSPCPPYPSPYRPGTLTVLTKVAHRRTECVFPGGIMYFPTLRFTGFSLRCSVSPRQEESQKMIFISMLREPHGFPWHPEKHPASRHLARARTAGVRDRAGWKPELPGSFRRPRPRPGGQIPELRQPRLAGQSPSRNRSGRSMPVLGPARKARDTIRREGVHSAGRHGEMAGRRCR